MNLKTKKELASRTLGVGKGRIRFVESRIPEIKEAITKQDIRDLVQDKAILIKEITGKKKVRKKARRSPGNIRKKIKQRKRLYMVLTRKLRKYLAEMKKQGNITQDELKKMRKKIKNKEFANLKAIKQHIKETSK